MSRDALTATAAKNYVDIFVYDITSDLVADICMVIVVMRQTLLKLVARRVDGSSFRGLYIAGYREGGMISPQPGSVLIVRVEPWPWWLCH